MIKILLDTDIGTDVDDAVCLAYLLAHQECDLLGITTVTGEADKRAALASALCRAAGKEVPIYPGLETPMVGEQMQKLAQQAVALAGWPHQSQFPQGQAIEFMSQTIRAHPGEVVLLTIGPLTNIGQLFTADPGIARLLKGLVLMGGIFTEAYPDKNRTEWNVSGDPLATEIVYQTPVGVVVSRSASETEPPLHRSIGLDVTEQVIMPADDVRQRFTAPLLRPVLDMAEIWFEHFFPFIVFHDPLAAATIFEPTLCEYRPGTVTVDSRERPRLTHFTPGEASAPHQVAVSVDAQRYFDHFFSVFQE
jgi:inosine-uridine nucleoside N-ribohydrolase